jgi:hypothetical protein
MHGDFSRGHRPDRGRGRRYQRVLLQQGRALLDSDFNALSDASEWRLRELAMDLGLGSGSPDGGYLITAGPVLARFESLVHVTPSAAPFAVRLDHRQKLGERLPSLMLDATQGKGSVSITLGHPLAGLKAVRLWVRAPASLRVGVGNAPPQPLPGGGSPERLAPHELPVPAGAASTLVLSFEESGRGRQAWIALVEGVPEEADAVPFWVSRGRFRVGGLAVELREDGPWPQVAFPLEKGFTPRPSPAPGTYVAYLEAWERHVTAVEDPGLRETSLGVAQDTCTRVEAVGQVKLAQIDPTRVPKDAREVEALRAAFTSVGVSASTLELGGAYSGAAGWLYRFEVHQGGARGQATLKWSRNNGADQYPAVRLGDGGAVRVPSTADVRDGDLIEVLSETVDLGDSGEGQVSGPAYAFTPPSRRVGSLFYVREGGITELGRRLELRDLETKAPTKLDEALAGQPGLKVRLWHGLLKTTSGGLAPLAVENGISVTPGGGPFRAGECWQYEARRGVTVEAGAWKAAPHGPERLFTPLAILKIPAPPALTEVSRWLDGAPGADHRLTADRVSFDGAGLGTLADTVQEALEELYGRGQHECVASLEPGRDGEDDGARLMALLQSPLFPGGVVCLGRGLFVLRTTVEVGAKAVELRGTKGTVVVADVPGASGFRVGAGGRLTLQGMTLTAGGSSGPALISLTPDAESLCVQDCGLVHARGGSGGTALSAASAAPVLPPRERGEEKDWEGFNPTGPAIELRDCLVAAGWGVVADDIEALSLRGSTLLCAEGGAAVRDVRLLELAGALVDTGLDAAGLAELASVLPETLEQVLEQKVAALQVAPHAQGVALRAVRVGRGTVEDSLLAASMGLWVTAAANLRLERNRYLAGDTAVRIDSATDTVLEGEEVAAGLLGVHVPVAATGLLLSSCRVSRTQRGVVLGGEYLAAPTPEQRASFPPPSLVSLRDVRVSACTFEGSKAALHLGPYAYDEAEPPAVELWNLEVGSSLLRGMQPQAVALSAVAPFPGGTSPAVRVTSNQLEAQNVAVWVTGGGVELSGNRVYADGPGALDEAWPTGAVMLVASGLMWVEANVVELGSTGCGLCVRGSHDVRVARNTFLGPTESRPLWGVDGQRLEVVENDLRAGQSLLARVEGVDVRSNHVGGALMLRNSGGGVVAYNRVDGTEDFPLSIELARGRWQVSGNTVASGLRVLPRATSTLLDDINGVAAELPGAGTIGLGAPLRPPWLSRQSSEGSPKKWVGDLVEQLQGVISELVSFGASLGRIVAGADQVEGEVHLLVQGNWSTDLQVGSVHPQEPGRGQMPGWQVAAPLEQSVVQVLGNRVEARLAVNHYTRCIIAHNVSQKQFVGPASGTRLHDSNLALE